jgi:DNA-binding CsgD family transcriptional regulator
VSQTSRGSPDRVSPPRVSSAPVPSATAAGETGVSLLRRWLSAHSSSKASFDDPAAAREEFDQFFTYIFNGSLDGISVLDLDFTILGANTALESLYAHELPLIGKKCYEAYHGRTSPCEHCPTAVAIASARTQTGIVAYEGEGTRRGDQELSVFPVFDDRGRVFGVIEYVRDISGASDERRAVENLKRRIQFQDHSLKEREAVVDYLLRRNGEAERLLARDVATNVELLIGPLLKGIRSRCTDPELAADLGLLEERLADIASPYLRSLSASNAGLSRRELEVAALIREGRSSKDIASLLRITEKAVDFHRMNLRRKLGIMGTGESLFERLRELDAGPPGPAPASFPSAPPENT